MTTSRTTQIEMVPEGTSDRRYWYGHGMSADVEEMSAGCAFRLIGVNADRMVVEWRYSDETGHRAFMTEDGNGHRWELGKPRTIEALRKAVSGYWNRSTVTTYRVSAPVELPFPNEY